MAHKINPFKPMSPVQHGMFVGRLDEIKRLENCLLQTRAGNSTNFIIVGERGIGKSSLLFYMKAVAQGYIDIDSKSLKYLVVDTDLDEPVSQLGLVKKIEMGLRHALADTEQARAFFKETWKFLQHIEAAGIRLHPEIEDLDNDTAIEEFSYSLCSTVERLCSDGKWQDIFNAHYDGVLILIDEADNASKSLRLGSFLKLLFERLQRRGCSKLMVGLAGLPDLRSVLTASHPSSLRLFEEIELNRLVTNEVQQVIERGLLEANRQNDKVISIDDDARNLLIGFSEGFPHFIQQFCYSAFNYDTDDLISKDDVMRGALDKNGALQSIGNRYYREDYYEKIKKESYRQILRIMADHLDDWVTKKDIRETFKGSSNVLDNAIHALRERRIIIAKEGERGIYRLQNRGFAFWIKLYTGKSDWLAEVTS